MKLLVVSDTHGDTAPLEQVLLKEQDADALFFLGDGVDDLDEVMRSHPKMDAYTVRGNCDMGSLYPAEGITTMEHLLVFYTHGHLYGVKNGLYTIAEEAKARGADVVLFGHTHCPTLEKISGITLFNPGSLSTWCGRGTYGVITMKDGVPEFDVRSIRE